MEIFCCFLVEFTCNFLLFIYLFLFCFHAILFCVVGVLRGFVLSVRRQRGARNARLVVVERQLAGNEKVQLHHRLADDDCRTR